MSTVLDFTGLNMVCSCSVTPTVASLSDRIIFTNAVIQLIPSLVLISSVAQIVYIVAAACHCCVQHYNIIWHLQGWPFLVRCIRVLGRVLEHWNEHADQHDDAIIARARSVRAACHTTAQLWHARSIGVSDGRVRWRGRNILGKDLSQTRWSSDSCDVMHSGVEWTTYCHLRALNLSLM